MAVGDLTDEQFEALSPEERAAVQRLQMDVDAGRVHPASSVFDLSPAELVAERRAYALAVLQGRMAGRRARRAG